MSRGLRLAQLRAERKDIPTLQSLSEFFDGELREKIIEKTFFRWETLPPKFKERILRAGFLFERARKPELKENLTKIYYLIPEKDGRINVGAMLTVATAISVRLRERLQGIYTWLPFFNGEERAVWIFEQRFQRLFSELERKTKLWRRHQGIVRGKTTPLQQKLLSDNISIVAGGLEPFMVLRPFGEWASLTDDDLLAAAQATKKGEWDLAPKILERIQVSLEVKKAQKRLDELLWRLDDDKAMKRWDGEFYFVQLNSLVNFFGDKAPEEAKVGFRQPVCRKVVHYLVEARDLLALEGFTKVLKSIKEAYGLL